MSRRLIAKRHCPVCVFTVCLLERSVIRGSMRLAGAAIVMCQLRCGGSTESGSPSDASGASTESSSDSADTHDTDFDTTISFTDGTQLVFPSDATQAPLDQASAPDACPPLFLPTIDAAPERAAPDALAPVSCDFAPSDLACNTASECVVVELIECRCWDPAIGAKKNNSYNCPPPPCPPFGPCDAGSGLVAQDCKLAPDGRGLSVACVEGRCSTYVMAGDASGPD
jgi:hypothetical protein